MIRHPLFAALLGLLSTLSLNAGAQAPEGAAQVSPPTPQQIACPAPCEVQIQVRVGSPQAPPQAQLTPPQPQAPQPQAPQMQLQRQPPPLAYPTRALRPARYELRANKPLLIIGGAMFGALWTSYAVVGAGWGNYKLMIPVAGPLFAWEDRHEFVRSVLLFSSLVQAAGIVIFTIGLATKRRVRVEEPRWSLAPYAAPTLDHTRALGGEGGLRLAGVF